MFLSMSLCFLCFLCYMFMLLIFLKILSQRFPLFYRRPYRIGFLHIKKKNIKIGVMVWNLQAEEDERIDARTYLMSSHIKSWNDLIHKVRTSELHQNFTRSDTKQELSLGSLDPKQCRARWLPNLYCIFSQLD